MADSITQSGLSKSLSGRDILILAVGAMIGWGWIIQTGYWLDVGGVWGAIGAFVLGGIMVCIVALIYGELASAMPFVGGEHVYSYRAFGPLGSFVCTWAIIFGYVSVVVFEAIALPSALAYVVPGFNAVPLWTIGGETVYATWVLVGGVGAAGMTYLNYRGVRPAAQLQAVLTVVIFLAGVVLFAGGLTNGQPSPDPAFGGAGLAGVFTVAIMTPFMFVGFDVIPQAAEEADMGPGALGGLILVAVVVAAAFYIAVLWASGRALPGAVLESSSLPAARAMADLFASPLVGQLMAIAGVAGILTSWNGFIVGGSRAIFALAESGQLPETLAKVHPEHRTPKNAILLIGLVSIAAPLFGEQLLVWIVNAGGFGIVLAWLLVSIAFLVLRYREPEMERPLKLPGGYLVGVVAVGITLFFVGLYLPGSPSALAWPEWLIVLAWVGLGVVLVAVTDGGSEAPGEGTVAEGEREAAETD